MKTGALDKYVDRLVRNKKSALCLEAIESSRTMRMPYRQINQISVDSLVDLSGIIATNSVTYRGSPYFDITSANGSFNTRGLISERIPKKVGIALKLNQNDATISASVSRNVDNYTVLLIHGEAFKDETGKTVTVYGNSQIDTSVYKIGNGSMKFDGTNSYVSISNNKDFYLSDYDFTIDFWVRLNTLPSAGYLMPFYQHRTDTANEMSTYAVNISGTYYIYSRIQTNGVYLVNIQYPISLVTNRWYHIALVRNREIFRLFIDGVSVASVVYGGKIPRYQKGFWIGANPDSNYYLNGWIDEFRFSKGVARWTSNFTSPTTPYDFGNYVSAPLTQIGSTGYYRSELIDVSGQPAGQSVGAKISFSGSTARVQGIGIYYR